MLRLICSSGTEQFLERLAEDLHALRQEHAALTAAYLVLPNRNVEAYVRFGLTQQVGIAANLEVQSLRNFVVDLALRASAPVRVVGATELRALLLGMLLDEELLARKELGPVRAYLHAAGIGADAVDLRRFQLADQLSILFEEYTYSRDQMLAEWPRRLVLQDTSFAEAEQWQRALWLELFSPDGVLARRGAEGGVTWAHPGALADVLDAR